MKVGVIANPNKVGAVPACHRLRKELKEHDIELVYFRETASFLNEPGGLNEAEFAEVSDLIVVLGGDGTMLHAVATLDCPKVPVVGINIGTLGFLTSCTDEEIPQFVDALVKRDYQISRRTLLKATVTKEDGKKEQFMALNEAALARGYTGRLVSLSVHINDKLLNHYRADGLLVATPTGSTAYSLSAGGPLISPSAEVFVITPICPHTLSQRSLVVANSAKIRLTPDPALTESMLFTVDGHDCAEIGSGDTIEIERFSRTLNFVRLENRSFYEALREKLHWRGG